MRYCEKCGQLLNKEAKFCAFCGEQVKNIYDKDLEREMEYAGELYKCPNCGEVLSSFMVNCPSCGYEVRDIEVADAVQEFASKLEQIEAKKMPFEPERRSFMKTVFGIDFQSDEEDAAKSRFKEQKNSEKANLICNYPVPNTKEDILEFFLLISSNIDSKHGIDDTVSKAWITKLDQIYQKAEILFGSEPEFERIKKLYEKKKMEIKIAKWKVILPTIAIVVFYVFLMGLLWNAVITIIIVVAIALIAGVAFYKWHKKIK